MRPRRAHALSFAPALVVGVALTAACVPGTERESGPRPDVIFILVDTLRADYLGTYGFDGPVSPNIDRLARDSVQFELCVAAAPWTKPSVASIFTSLFPQTHGVVEDKNRWARGVKYRTDALPDEAITMAEVFRAHGYRTAAWSANAWISDRLGFSQGFDEFHETPNGNQNILNGEKMLAQAWEWLNSVGEEQPVFLYVHLMDTHLPWRWNSEAWELLKDSRSLGDDRAMTPGEMGRGPGLSSFPHASRNVGNRLTLWRAAYAAGVRVMDDRLGVFLNKLEASGRMDKSVIVFTADHGEELLDHGGWDHGSNLYHHQTRVPLLVRLPGGSQAGRVIRRTTSLLDLMPTLLSAASISERPPMQGEDLWESILEGGLEDRPAWAIAQGVKRKPRMVSMENRKYKLIWDYQDDSSLLFDREQDPQERTNLADSRPDLLEELAGRLLSEMQRIEKEPTLLQKGVVLTDEEIERLRSLGYLQ